jgi:predicted nucleotidyltransferase
MQPALALEILRSAAPDLRRRYGVVAARLFGSTARGEADSLSDIDVAVEFEGAATPDVMSLCGVSGLLGDLFEADVDVVALPARDAALNAAILREATVAF